MRFFFPVCGQALAQPSFVVKSLLPPLNWFCNFVQSQLDILLWVCILFHCSVHLSVLPASQGPGSRVYITDIHSETSHFILVFQDCLSYVRACAFPDEFQNKLSVSTKILVGTLIEILLNPQINLKRKNN